MNKWADTADKAAARVAHCLGRQRDVYSLPGSLPPAVSSRASSGPHLAKSSGLLLQIRLATKDGKPATGATNWNELTDDSQKLLLQIEEKLRESDRQSADLKASKRLAESTAMRKGFAAEVSSLSDEIQATAGLLSGEKEALAKLNAASMKLLQDTEKAYWLYERVKNRPKAIACAQNSTATYPEYLIAPPPRPSDFLVSATAEFEETLNSYKKRIEELEHLLGQSTARFGTEGISETMANTHDIFVHVASNVERIVEQVNAAKTRYLNRLQEMGDSRNPFEEADRRDALEASSKVAAYAAAVKPVENKPPQQAQQQPTPSLIGSAQASKSPFQLGGATTSTPSLFGSASQPSTAAAPSLFGTTSTTTAAPSLFGTPTQQPASKPAFSGFGAPATGGGLFGGASSSPAPSTGLFGTPTTTATQPNAFGTPSTPATGGLFGQATPGFGTPQTVTPKSRKPGRKRT
eukprot:scaffold7989_cov403-Prasinococcus_capsulatus_cf.AAC.3